MADDATSTDTASATEDEELDTTGTEDDGAAGDAGADQLGDAGKKALDRMKQQVKTTRSELAEYRKLGLSAADLQTLIAKSQEDSAKAEQARLRQEAESAALSKANERLIKAEVKAAAAGKLANPAIALRLLDLSDFDVNDDGEVDSDAISAAIDELLKNEPYLGVTQGEPKRFQGTGDGGARGEAGGKPQLTEADVKQLYKERRYTEIDAARRDGRLDKVLGTTT